MPTWALTRLLCILLAALLLCSASTPTCQRCKKARFTAPEVPICAHHGESPKRVARLQGASTNKLAAQLYTVVGKNFSPFRPTKKELPSENSSFEEWEPPSPRGLLQDSWLKGRLRVRTAMYLRLRNKLLYCCQPRYSHPHATAWRAQCW